MDEVKLGLARNAAGQQGLTHVEFHVADVYDWRDPAGYDLVYCRNLLQHLRRPVDLLESMWGMVRLGGVLVVEDADFEGSFCDPPDAGFAFWVDIYQQVLRRHGGDPLTGRKLHRYFPDAGIPTPEVSVVQRLDVAGEAKTLPCSTIEATSAAIVSTGIASETEVQSALDRLAALAADPGYLCGSPRLFQAWSRRPMADC
jgi:SAM-dependent methyltransferase